MKSLGSFVVDLDGDGTKEGIAFVDGKLSSLAYIVEDVGGERHYYAVGVQPPANGGAPIAFTLDGATYLVSVGKTVEVGGKKSNPLMVARFDGYTYVLDTIR
jgi:hypothetical protein